MKTLEQYRAEASYELATNQIALAMAKDIAPQPSREVAVRLSITEGSGRLGIGFTFLISCTLAMMGIMTGLDPFITGLTVCAPVATNWISFKPRKHHSDCCNCFDAKADSSMRKMQEVKDRKSWQHEYLRIVQGPCWLVPAPGKRQKGARYDMVCSSHSIH